MTAILVHARRVRQRGEDELARRIERDPAGSSAPPLVNLHEEGIGADCSVPGEYDLVPVQGNIEVSSG